MTPADAELRFPNAATPLGSAKYYSLRFAPAPRRSDLALILLWHWELWRIRDDCRDPGVARLKLDWWRQELQEARLGRGQHPMSPALSDLIQRHRLPSGPFLGLADAVEQDLLRTPYPGLSELMEYADQATGGLMELLTRILGAEEEEAALARELGIGIRLVEVVQELGGDLRRQRCYLPTESLKQVGLRPDELTTPGAATALKSLLATFSARIQSHQELALERSRAARRRLGPALALAAIAHATLKEIRDSDYPVLQQHIRLTPWRSLWIAWGAQWR